MASKILRGQSLRGVINLKTDDGVNPNNILPYPILNTDIIEVHFPGTSSSVILSTANSGEVTILNGPEGQFSYLGSPAKSLMLAVGNNLSIDVKVTHVDTTVDFFEAQKIINIKDPDNP